MKRLTYRDKEGRAQWMPELLEDDTGMAGALILGKLADYEGQGLEPKEIARILDAYGRGMTLRTENAKRLEIVKDIQTDRLRELAQAELEGRIVLRSAGSGKKCGSCVHWHRISETKRGTCDVRQWERNRWGHMEPWRHSFTPAQSYGACRYYIPEEDSANG